MKGLLKLATLCLCLCLCICQEVIENNGVVPEAWMDAPDPHRHKHHKHHKHRHKHGGETKQMVKGVDYFNHHESHGQLYDWNSFKPTNPVPKENMVPMNPSPSILQVPMGEGKPVADMNLHQPVYVSMTTTSERIRYVAYSLIDVFKGSVVPTHVFLFVSSNGFLTDKGIQKEQLPKALQDLAATQPLTIVFTKNIGPHRRLLPLLSKFWNTDCVIIALDDDKPSDYTQSAVEKLLGYYIHSGKSQIVALKARRIGLCPTLDKVGSFDGCTWPVVRNEKSELLSMPDGTGGVLYRPKFFHEIVFDPDLLELTKYNDDIAFRLASLVKGTHVFMGSSNFDEPPECTAETEAVSDRVTGGNRGASYTPPPATATSTAASAPSPEIQATKGDTESPGKDPKSMQNVDSSTDNSGFLFRTRRHLQAIDINARQRIDLNTGLPVGDPMPSIPSTPSFGIGGVENPAHYRSQELPGLDKVRDMTAMGIPVPRPPSPPPQPPRVVAPPMEGGLTPIPGSAALAFGGAGGVSAGAALSEINHAINPGDKRNWVDNKMKNSYMWTDGLTFLELNGYFNFTELILNNVRKERKECLFRAKHGNYLIPDQQVILQCGFKAYATTCDDISQYHFESV